jgi:hypothetical protein
LSAVANGTLSWSSANATSRSTCRTWRGSPATFGTYPAAVHGATPHYVLAGAKSVGCGFGPTADFAGHVGPYTVHTYTSGIAAGTYYAIPKIWHPTNGAPPYPGVVFVPGLNSSYTKAPYMVTIGGKPWSRPTTHNGEPSSPRTASS